MNHYLLVHTAKDGTRTEQKAYPLSLEDQARNYSNEGWDVRMREGLVLAQRNGEQLMLQKQQPVRG